MFYCVSALRIDTCQTITKQIWTQQNPRAKWLRKEISSVSFAPQCSWEFSVPILLEHFRALGTNVQPAITATCRPASTLEHLIYKIGFLWFLCTHWIHWKRNFWVKSSSDLNRTCNSLLHATGRLWPCPKKQHHIVQWISSWELVAVKKWRELGVPPSTFWRMFRGTLMVSS